MSNLKGPEISVNEIMQTIKERLEKRRTSSHLERSDDERERSMGNSEGDLFLDQGDFHKPCDKGVMGNLLWKYGTKYAFFFKRVPIIKNIAEKWYWKLARGQNSPDEVAAVSSRLTNSGSDILEANLNYDGFLEQLRKEGLKGRIKLAIFTVIGFFAWWQGQVNRAFYAALAKQEAQIAERDRTIRDLEYRLSVLSHTEDALYEELTSQRAEIARQGRELLKHRNDQPFDSKDGSRTE
ncbi:MAG TPA: hypothetical protein VEI96_04195 [Thermodesulfovibrionales bacterium]|nr:hypothetical protein [Thermodesulfovibrionales bacterium]